VGLADRLCLYTSVRSPRPALVISRVPGSPNRGGLMAHMLKAI
jgi:hypothetical protein